MAHYYCRWCGGMSFIRWEVTNSDYAVAKAGNEDYYWEWV
jgi:hypothetical protein